MAQYPDCEVCGAEVETCDRDAHEDAHMASVVCSLDQCQYSVPELAEAILEQSRSILEDDTLCAWVEVDKDVAGNSVDEAHDWIIDECETALSDAGYTVYSDGNSWIVYAG